MDKASKDYINSRNTATDAEQFSRGVTPEKAHEAKQKMKRIVSGAKNRTEESVKEAKEWWDARK
jgi:hypothetical protein